MSLFGMSFAQDDFFRKTPCLCEHTATIKIGVLFDYRHCNFFKLNFLGHKIAPAPFNIYLVLSLMTFLRAKLLEG